MGFRTFEAFYSVEKGFSKLLSGKEIIKNNKWQRRICTLSVQLYSDIKSVNSSICPTKLLIIVIIRCWSYSEIIIVLCSLFSVLTFFFILSWKTCQWEKMLSSLLYLTLVTSCIIYQFLCYHQLYLIIYLISRNIGNFSKWLHGTHICQFHV